MEAVTNPWAAVRAAAAARAAALGQPTSALEDWRYVQVKPLTRSDWSSIAVTAAALAPHRLTATPVVVLVDGVLRPEFSDPVAAVIPLKNLSATQRDAVITRWTEQIAACTDPTECATIAGCAGGAHITASPDVVQVLAISTGADHGGRIIIDVPPSSSLDLVISHVDLAPSSAKLGFEVTVGANARLRVDELQYSAHAAGTALCLPHLRLRAERDATIQWSLAAQGGELVRFRSTVDIAAAGASVQLNGLQVLNGQRQAHVHTRVAHNAGNAGSQQLFKTIADGQSLASFDGLVAVAKGADGTDAKQANHNLLLSPKARVDTRPQLDILADDVKASHGATVGRPNPDELFYLRSRGLSADLAMNVLMRGFADDVLLRFHHQAARALAARVITGR